MRFTLISLVSALIITSPVLAITFTEDFDAGWSGSGDWSVEGVSNPGLPVTEFPAADGRLDDNAARTAGGLWYEYGTSGNGSQFAGGDNEEVWLDYHMSVPNGVYTFNVNLDAQMKWSDPVQSYGQSFAMYMGDAADMAYGSILPFGNPTGPWSGISHGSDINTALTGDKWNGPDVDDGTWTNLDFSQVYVGGSGFAPTINVTSGEVIFRMTIRLKNKDQASPEFRSYAMDNLVVQLVPEPASLALFGFGLLFLRRKHR